MTDLTDTDTMDMQAALDEITRLRALVATLSDDEAINLKLATVAEHRAEAAEAKLASLVPALSDRNKAIIDMRNEGYTYKEISERYGITPNACRVIAIKGGCGCVFANYRGPVEGGSVMSDRWKEMRRKRKERGMVDNGPRDEMVYTCRANGETMQQVANRFQMSKDTVRKVCLKIRRRSYTAALYRSEIGVI